MNYTVAGSAGMWGVQGKESSDVDFCKASLSFAASSPNSKKISTLSVFNSEAQVFIMTCHQHTISAEKLFDVQLNPLLQAERNRHFKVQTHVKVAVSQLK